MSKRVAVVQSNYIPWKGYFDLINSVDEFVLYDDVQYTRRDWRNRNLIKTMNGPTWLTIPVEVKGRYLQRIRDTIVSDPKWNVRHWKTVASTYAKAPYFREYRGAIEELYLGCTESTLSLINRRFLVGICGMLGIRTAISSSMDYELAEGRTERLVDLCARAGADEYVSGPAAKAYLATELFAQRGIRVSFFDYSGYPEYPQLFPPFAHGVTVLDLIFNTGKSATSYMLSFAGP